MEHNNLESASPQESDPKATAILPRFPGYRELVVGDQITFGDSFMWKGELEAILPNNCGEIIEAQDVGKYFRPIPQAPADSYLKDALSGKGFHPDPDILRESLQNLAAQPVDLPVTPATPIPSFLTYAHALFRFGNILQEFKDNKDNGKSTVTLRSAEIKDLREAYHAFKSNSQMAATNEALSAQVSSLVSTIAAARGALWNAFIAMGRAGANADLNHPMRKDWEDARAALALIEVEK